MYGSSDDVLYFFSLQEIVHIHYGEIDKKILEVKSWCIKLCVRKAAIERTIEYTRRM